MKRSVRGVLVAGALTVGAVALPAAPAVAAPITVPGVGTFEIPGLPGPVPAFPGGAPAAPGNNAAQSAVDAALSKIGAPYVYGATGPDAFDCSGLIKWSFEQAGREIPRTSEAQASAGAPVSQGDLLPGDVVLFNGAGHAALYVGDGNVVHASTSGTPVKLAPVSSMSFYDARRY